MDAWPYLAARLPKPELPLKKPKGMFTLCTDVRFGRLSSESADLLPLPMLLQQMAE
jgi:hypothetical protein